VSTLTDPTAIAGSPSQTNATERTAVKVDGALLVDAGASQEVGGIDPNFGINGSVVLADNAGSGTSSLTADHINLNSLVIGNGATFSLAPSDASGAPMAGSSLALAGSLAPTSSFAAGGNLLSAGGTNSSSPALGLSGLAGGASGSAVPEPSTFVLLAAAIAALAFAGVRRRA
jgi:hypothetical protein